MGGLHVLLTVSSLNDYHLLYHVFAIDERAGDCLRSLRSSTIHHSHGFFLYGLDE
jgi:hypothetical protein